MSALFPNFSCKKNMYVSILPNKVNEIKVLSWQVEIPSSRQPHYEPKLFINIVSADINEVHFIRIKKRKHNSILINNSEGPIIFIFSVKFVSIKS